MQNIIKNDLSWSDLRLWENINTLIIGDFNEILLKLWMTIINSIYTF